METNRPLTISAQFGLIDQIDFFKKTVASQDLSSYYLLLNGEFAYNKSYSSEYPWGAIKRLDLYDKGALSSLYICFKPKGTIDSDYLVHYFESSKWHQGMANIAGEGARNHGLLNIAIPDFFNTIHYLPNVSEQRKIADFLNLIEERIAVQNKVIEDFKMLKATLSRKLLWDNPLLSKRVQLSNFGTLKNGYAFKSSEYIPESEFRIVTIANVTGEREISINNCNTIHSLPRDIQEHQKLKPNDILVSLTGNVGRVSLCNLDGCLLNQRVGLFVLNDDYLHEYIFQVLSDIRFLQSMINSGQGAAQMNIGKYDVESFFIPFSEDLNLLNKIAGMLYSIDLRITQSMKDLLLLRKQKHYFLSNLFI